MGVFHHDFFSTPMLLSSSELMFETSRSAPARATNKSSKINTTIANIFHSFHYSYYNNTGVKKIYPLTVLILSCNQFARNYLLTNKNKFCSKNHTSSKRNGCAEFHSKW